MEKITITKVYRSNKDKKGILLTTSDGREYTRLALKTKEHGDSWVSGFGNDKNASWKEGDIVEVVIEKKGQYINFSVPKEKDITMERLDKIEADIKELKNLINGNPAMIKDDRDTIEEVPF